MRDSRPDTIAVLRARAGLGDMLCAVPAIRALREVGAPGATITLVGLESAAWLLDDYPGIVDDIIPIDGCPGLSAPPTDARRALDALVAAQERRFDLAVGLHGTDPDANAVLALLGATQTVGAIEPGGCPPCDGMWLVQEGHAYEARRLADVVGQLGVEVDDQLEPPHGGADRAAALLVEVGLDAGNYVVVHPGASAASRRWAVNGFAAAANYLRRRDVPVAVTGGSGERDLAAAMAERVPDIIDLTGRTSIAELAAIVATAQLVVCNDNGVAQLAAATKTPSVSVVTGAELDRWAPEDRELHHPVVLEGPADTPEEIDLVVAAVAGALELAGVTPRLPV